MNLPRRIYRGDGLWAIEPEEAATLCADGEVVVDGKPESIVRAGSCGAFSGRVLVRVGNDQSPYRAYCDFDLALGEVRTA